MIEVQPVNCCKKKNETIPTKPIKPKPIRTITTTSPKAKESLKPTNTTNTTTNNTPEVIPEPVIEPNIINNPNVTTENYTEPVVNQTKKGECDEKGTGACANGALTTTNALGLLGASTLAITAPPYTVNRCDQVIIINGQEIPDIRDFSKKNPAVFTLSLYMLNLFSTMSANDLIDSMLIEDMTDVPDTLFGEPRCIEFKNTKKLQRIVMCVNNKREVKQIIDSYMNFMKCRIGNSLKKLDYNEMRKIFQIACLGQHIPNSKAGTSVITFMRSMLPNQEV